MPSPVQADRELLVTQTATYRPTTSGVLPGFAGTGGFTGMGSLFSLAVCDQMAKDDTIALGLKYLQTPVVNATIEVESEDSAEKAWVERQVDKFWRGTGLAVAMRDDVYGRRPAEVVYQREGGLWHFGRLEPLHPRDVQPYTYQGHLVYLEVSGNTSHPVVEANHPDVEWARPPGRQDDDPGCWKLKAATANRPAKGSWWVNDPTLNKWYGVLVLEPCWWAWRAKTQPDAMLEALLKWVYKWGVSPCIIRHPDMVYEEDDKDGEPVPAGDYARKILEELKAAGIVALSSARDKSGNYLWDIQQWCQAVGVASNLIEPIEFLNKMMLRSLGIPDEVLQFTGEGSQARAKVSTSTFYLSRQLYAGIKLEQFDAQVLRPMARKNGFPATYRVKLKPFLEDPALAGNSQDAVPGQPPGGGDDPLAALFGSLPGSGSGAPANGAPANGEPKPNAAPAGGIPMALGARGGLGGANGHSPAVSFYDALCEELRSRREGIDLAWVRTPGPKSQNRWVNSETGKIRYQAEEPGSVKTRIAAKQGQVDPGQLRQAMEQHRTTQPLSERQRGHAGQAWQMLKAHHGGNALHRVKELVEADLQALASGQTYHRNGARLLDRLQGWRHIVEQAQAEGQLPAAPGAAPVQAPAPPAVDAPWEGKGEVRHGQVYNAPVEHLHMDPAQFQYKVSGIGSEGVTDEMKQVKVWNPDFAGVVSVWQDPATGKTMVVNGHHRYELAHRLGVKDLAVRYIKAKDAKEARAIGALINIAEGRGTALDAAKFMRDTGTSPEDFTKHGISLKGKVADSAVVLTKLSDRAFRALAEGDLDEGKALAVAKHLPDHDLQDTLFARLKQREEEGKDYSPKVVEEMARALALTPQAEQSGGLFDLGSVPLIEERAEVAAFVRAELAKEANAWKAVASEQKARRVTGEGKGNVLDVERNKEVAQEADRAQNAYDQLLNVKGPIAAAVGVAAEELAKAKTRKDRDHAKQRAVEAVRAAIRSEQEGTAGGVAVGGAEGTAVRGGEGAPAPAASEAAPDAGRGDSEPPGVAPEEKPEERRRVDFEGDPNLRLHDIVEDAEGKQYTVQGGRSGTAWLAPIVGGKPQAHGTQQIRYAYRDAAKALHPGAMTGDLYHTGRNWQDEQDAAKGVPGAPQDVFVGGGAERTPAGAAGTAPAGAGEPEAVIASPAVAAAAPPLALPEHEAVAALKALGLRHADAVHLARATAGQGKDAVLAAGRAKLAEAPAANPPVQTPAPAPAAVNPPPPPPGGKLAWQMTPAEWAAKHPGREATHRARVERALAEGLPVPAEVRQALGLNEEAPAEILAGGKADNVPDAAPALKKPAPELPPHSQPKPAPEPQPAAGGDRQAMIDRIVKASQRTPDPIVRGEMVLTDDGKWRDPMHFPIGVRPVEPRQVRIHYSYRHPDGHTYGRMYATEEEARLAQQQERNQEEQHFRRTLESADPETFTRHAEAHLMPSEAAEVRSAMGLPPPPPPPDAGDPMNKKLRDVMGGASNTATLGTVEHADTTYRLFAKRNLGQRGGFDVMISAKGGKPQKLTNYNSDFTVGSLFDYLRENVLAQGAKLTPAQPKRPEVADAQARFLQDKGYASPQEVPPGERATLQAEWQATEEYARLKR